ncbi:MAG TPA: MoxR family ATPase [Puia sp.]|nr:MoxR family ATPase [Puia sp.]
MIKLRNLDINNAAENYLPSPGLLNALEVAFMLKRPLLLTGEPGTGKTQFAFWAADQLAKSNGFLPQPLVYNTKTSSTAKDLFYHYDAIAHFRESRAAADHHKSTEDFIQLRALGLAIAGAVGRKDLTLSPAILNRSGISDEPRSSVVLIDEIDKAPRDFPNDLLNEVEYYEFEIAELDERVRLTADTQRRNIIIILTSNFEKNLPDAFLRRCIYYHIDFPDKQRLFEIIVRRLDVSEDEYADIDRRVDDFFRFHQYPNISKRPSTSECIDWMRVLKEDQVLDRQFFFGSELILDAALTKYLPILIKGKDDLARMLNP